MTRRDALKLLAYALLMHSALEPPIPARAQHARLEAENQQRLNQDLIKAIRAHDARAVRDLLKQGADANAKDLDAKPDRHGTVQPPFTTEPPTALLILFDDARTYTGKQEKEQAQYKLRPDPFEIVKALLDAGANPNVIDYDQTFPLLVAVQNRYTKSVHLLLAHHADPNKTWVHGITPLHNAVSNQDVPTVKLLLAAGANPASRSAFDNPAHPLADEVATLLKKAQKTAPKSTSKATSKEPAH